MNPKPTTFVLPLLALLALLLSACSTKKSYFIGVSQCSEDSWRTKMNSEIRRESYLYDNVRVEFASAKDDNRVQIAQIEHFIEEGADLIIVSPNEAKALTPVINKAFDRGVRVVLVDRKSASDNGTRQWFSRGSGTLSANKSGGQRLCRLV